MTYRKSYYEQRMEENDKIARAVQAQVDRQIELTENPEAPEPEDVVEPVVAETPEVKPDASWAKPAIQKWLDEHEIKYTRWMSKAKLLDLVD